MPAAAATAADGPSGSGFLPAATTPDLFAAATTPDLFAAAAGAVAPDGALAPAAGVAAGVATVGALAVALDGVFDPGT